MNVEEIRGLATEDLEKMVSDTKEEIFKLRYAARAESLDNTKKIRDARKKLARVKTVLRERELQAAAREQGN